ncbi:MAG: leucine-rich repeat protein [Lachnospiraceae bacterium]|jgi:hypothetical protein|nr:leucine-rich repeat protein [Lachnospiraceae bacterium]
MPRAKYKTYQDFVYRIENGEAVVVKYTGDSAEVTVPGYIEGVPVKCTTARVGGTACFYQCPTLRKVTFAEGIEKIGIFTFNGCAALESLVIPASVTELDTNGCPALTHITVAADNPQYADDDGILYYKGKNIIAYYPPGRSGHYTIPAGMSSIGIRAFCRGTLQSVTIPASMTEIKSSVFTDCRQLTTVAIEEGVEKIGSRAFMNCEALISIKLPASMKKIDFAAFLNCTSLADLVIPAGVTEIGFDAFSGCSALKNLAIPEGVECIRQRTFRNCTSLKRISIPASVNRLDEDAFYGCKELECIEVDEKNPHFMVATGALYEKKTNFLIYTPICQRLRNAGRATSLAELAGLPDRELVTKIGAELGYSCHFVTEDIEDLIAWWQTGDEGYFHDRIHACFVDERVTKLRLAGLDFDRLPLTIAALSSLRQLDISHTDVAELPEWVGTLQALEELNLYETKIPALPDSIGHLTALKALYLGHNGQLTKLPDSLCNLASLEKLSLQHTRVGALPEDIGNCMALREINLHGSQIKHLPKSIGNLAELRGLFAYYMPLRDLPPTIGNLAKLERLWICQTDVCKLPESIGNLTALTDFNYDCNSIKDVPERLHRLYEAKKRERVRETIGGRRLRG